MLVIHPTGNQNSRHAAQAFAEIGELDAFITALKVDAASDKFRFLPRRLLTEVGRRDFSQVGGRVMAAAPLREWSRLVAARLGISESLGLTINRLCRVIDHASAHYIKRNPQIAAVYCYEDAALETFRAAKAAGARCIYELPIGYWREHRRLKQEEARRRPEWAHTWDADYDSVQKCQRKDQEIALADQIIVASRFTERTLQTFPGPIAPCTVVPYGCPPPISAESRDWYRGGPLRLLFVGSLSQRKGLAEVLELARQFGKQVQLSLIGVGPGEKMLQNYGAAIRYLGSRSHTGVLDEMRHHDILIFPSRFEGFGMVITEAMSQGMAVVASDRTGVSAIADEFSAIEIEAEVPEQLTHAIEGFLQRPARVEEMGRAALARAASWQWADYRARLRELTRT